MAEIRFGKVQWGPNVLIPLQREITTRVGVMLQATGTKAVAFLRSKTSELRPSWRGSGPRLAHPGHWADRTGQLAASYGFAVEDEPGLSVARLTLWNLAEYAIYLELHEGYYVLSGIMEPRGPVWVFMRQAARASGFKVDAGDEVPTESSYPFPETQ